MTKENLGYLYTRVKKPSLSKEEAERKVCQEVFIAKLGSDAELLRWSTSRKRRPTNKDLS